MGIAMREFEANEFVHAGIPVLWELFEDFSAYGKWTKSVSIVGGHEAGDKIEYAVTGNDVRGRPRIGRFIGNITQWEAPNRAAWDVGPSFILCVRFRFELQRMPAGTYVTHRVSVSGPMARWIGARVERALKPAMTRMLRDLKAQAETKGRSIRRGRRS